MSFAYHRTLQILIQLVSKWIKRKTTTTTTITTTTRTTTTTKQLSSRQKRKTNKENHNNKNDLTHFTCRTQIQSYFQKRNVFSYTDNLNAEHIISFTFAFNNDNGIYIIKYIFSYSAFLQCAQGARKNQGKR